MELKPNMYVRTKKGIIAKCTNILEDCSYDFDRIVYQDNYNEDGFMEIPYLLIDKYIIKASHNIIDLIEVGDIITTNNLCGEVTHIEGDKIYTTCYDGEYCYDYQIQSIVTKEMFESMKYEVK